MKLLLNNNSVVIISELDGEELRNLENCIVNGSYFESYFSIIEYGLISLSALNCAMVVGVINEL